MRAEYARFRFNPAFSLERVTVFQECEAATVIVQRTIDEWPALEERVSRRRPIEHIVNATRQFATF